MRLPTSKVWRAFPELDRFSDDQCARFVSLARTEHWIQMLGVAIGAVFVTLGVVVGGGFAMWHLVGGVARAIGSGRVLPQHEIIVAIMVTALPLIAGMLTTLFIRDGWLRMTIRRKLTSVRCPACGYSMLGLIIANGGVVCPECGVRVVLAERGLTPADLIAATTGQVA